MLDSDTPLVYESKTKDFDHQATTLGAVWTRGAFATVPIFWGLGTTQHVLGCAAGEIDQPTRLVSTRIYEQ